MKFLFLVLAFIPSQFLIAEGAPTNDAEFMRYMQAKAEAAQKEEEFKNPKNPELKADRAFLGNKNAPIKIFAYSDFQCPYCKRGYETVEEIRKKYKEKVVFMFKHLPLPFHPMAQPAAKRFEAIALQSAKKAYAFHDEVFKAQEGLSGGEAFLDELVKKVGADLAKVKKDLDSPKVKARIDADMAEAKKFNISGTPGFIVAGVSLKGAYPAPSFEEIIEKRLAEKKK